MTDDKMIGQLFRLDGRVGVVTGGSKGLGRAMASALAHAGAITIVCSRDLRACEVAATELATETGIESLAVSADVTSEEDVRKLFAAVDDRYGRIDVLINSAGIAIRNTIERLPAEDFRRVIETNLTGAWLCCRAVSSRMKARGMGSVINVGSALSEIGLPERSAYCASKSGLLGLTRALALEWAPAGVRCNALCPGPFKTEINLPLLRDPERGRMHVAQTALNRWAELHEIWGPTLFLASDASTYVTGAALYVDGGWTAK